MRKLCIASVAAFSVLGTSSLAFAQETETEDEIIVAPKKPKDIWVYADASLALSQFSTSDGNTTSVSDSMTNAYFRAGAKYKYFGAELEYGTGLSGISESGVSLEVGRQFSGFGILRLPNENYDVFLRAGYHSSSFDVSLNGVDIGLEQPVSGDGKIKSNGFAFGVGGTYFFSEKFGLRADITGYNTRDFIDAGYVGGSLGGTIKF